MNPWNEKEIWPEYKDGEGYVPPVNTSQTSLKIQTLVISLPLGCYHKLLYFVFVYEEKVIW
jgi:hypothetical protein